MQDTAECHHQSADAHLPQADRVCDDATALDTVMDMLDPVWSKNPDSIGFRGKTLRFSQYS
jgi:hypothetical protein